MFPLHQNLKFSPQPQQATNQPRPSAEDDYYGWLGPWDNRNLRGGSGFEVQRERDGGGFDPVYADGNSFDLQPGDRFVTTGYDSADMGAPGAAEGGRWVFAGTRHVDGPAVSGTDEGGNQAVYHTDWEWMPDTAPQQPAPQQPPQEPGQQQAIPARLPIYDNSPGGWDQYMDFARAETEGLNRMPFVYGAGPNTGTRFLTDDPAQQFQTFYPSNLQGWQEYMRNPMFESDAPPAAIGDAGTSAPRSRNPWDFTDTNWTNPIFR